MLLINSEERVCLACNESWPTGPDFFSSDASLICIACVSEGKRPPRTKAKKTRGVRTAEQERSHQAAKYLRHRDQYLQNMRKYYSLNKVEILAKRKAARAKRKTEAK
jgi:hypothetical protein